MLVVDASALTELVLRRPAGEIVGEHLAGHAFALHAPHLVDVEVLSALRRLVASSELTAARAGEAITDLLDLPIERYPHDILVPRVWELRENFSAYDASYVALAEAVGRRTRAAADRRRAPGPSGRRPPPRPGSSRRMSTFPRMGSFP